MPKDLEEFPAFIRGKITENLATPVSDEIINTFIEQTNTALTLLKEAYNRGTLQQRLVAHLALHSRLKSLECKAIKQHLLAKPDAELKQHLATCFKNALQTTNPEILANTSTAIDAFIQAYAQKWFKELMYYISHEHFNLADDFDSLAGYMCITFVCNCPILCRTDIYNPLHEQLKISLKDLIPYINVETNIENIREACQQFCPAAYVAAPRSTDVTLTNNPIQFLSTQHAQFIAIVLAIQPHMAADTLRPFVENANIFAANMRAAANEESEDEDEDEYDANDDKISSMIRHYYCASYFTRVKLRNIAQHYITESILPTWAQRSNNTWAIELIKAHDNGAWVKGATHILTETFYREVTDSFKIPAEWAAIPFAPAVASATSEAPKADTNKKPRLDTV